MSAINIIVPVFNTSAYLDEFFQSVLAQTFQDFTLFVVNDCSTDDSESLIKEYQTQFEGRMHYIKNPSNLGLGRTRNRGLDDTVQYPSKYVAFLDSDDVIAPDYLQSMHEKAETANADLVICGMQRFNDASGKKICVEALDETVDVVDDITKFHSLAYLNPAAYNKLYRTELIGEHRFPPMLRSEDTCFFFELLPNIKRIAFTNRISYRYRVRDASLTTASFDNRICASMFDGFEKAYDKYLIEKEYLPFKEMFETQIFIRSAVGGVLRASFADLSTTGSNINEAYAFMNRVMPDWRKNRYLSVGRGYHPVNLKQHFLRISAYLYQMHLFCLVVYTYYLYQRITGKEIRM